MKDLYEVQKTVVFISGLSGTGKTSVYRHFLENPLKGFHFFDYDNSNYVVQPSDKKPNWQKIIQFNWWLTVAKRTIQTNHLTPVILGTCPSPSIIKEYMDLEYFDFDHLRFALLKCNPEVRKARLQHRGQPELFHSHLPWHDVYLKDFKRFQEFEIDTADYSIDEVEANLLEYLHHLQLNNKECYSIR